MSKSSKKCNEICNKIQSISGLDNNYVYNKLLTLERSTDYIIDKINKYADKDQLNGISENLKKWIKS